MIGTNFGNIPRGITPYQSSSGSMKKGQSSDFQKSLSSVGTESKTITLHGSTDSDGNQVIGAWGDAVAGTSTTVYKPADFNPDDPKYLMKIWDNENHMIEERTVDISEIDVKNCDAFDMYAYSCHLSDCGEFSDAVTRFFMMPIQGEGFDKNYDVSSLYEKKDWLSLIKGFVDMQYNLGNLQGYKEFKSFYDYLLSNAKSVTQHDKSGKSVSASDLLKLLELSGKLTAKDLKKNDWRTMSADEWENMLGGIDEYIDAFKKEIKKLREAQEEAAEKAALEAPSDMKAIAAGQAALAAAAGFSAGDTETEENDESDSEEEKSKSKNWTKRLETDDQTILRQAKEAQKMEKMASRKIDEIASESSDYYSYQYVSVIERKEGSDKEKNENQQPLKIIAMDKNGIRCINDETHECEWEIKFKNDEEYQKAESIMKRVRSQMNEDDISSDKEIWMEWLS